MRKPKYRHLSLEELGHLKSEFVDYLVLNGITAGDWEKMKAKQPEEAEGIVSLFSDVVFEGIMRKTDYLEARSPKSLSSYHFQSDQIVKVGIRIPEGLELSFDDDDFLNSFQQAENDFEIFHSSEKYNQSRESDMFAMIQKGMQVSDGTLFKQICLGL